MPTDDNLESFPQLLTISFNELLCMRAEFDPEALEGAEEGQDIGGTHDGDLYVERAACRSKRCGHTQPPPNVVSLHGTRFIPTSSSHQALLEPWMLPTLYSHVLRYRRAKESGLRLRAAVQLNDEAYRGRTTSAAKVFEDDFSLPQQLLQANGHESGSDNGEGKRRSGSEEGSEGEPPAMWWPAVHHILTRYPHCFAIMSLYVTVSPSA